MSEYPPVLANLLEPPEANDDEAWATFVATYSRLLLHVCHSVSSGRDETMDAYAHLLEQLRRDRCARLRGYAVDARSTFLTWLVVVARHICADRNRTRFGRARTTDSDRSKGLRTLRREIETLVPGDVDTGLIADETFQGAEQEMRVAELNGALKHALAELEPADRLLLRLRFDDDLAAPEIARMLQYPSQFHVYRRVNALLATLRHVLSARGIQSAAP